MPLDWRGWPILKKGSFLQDPKIPEETTSFSVLLLPGDDWSKGSIDEDMLANTSKIPNGSPVTVVPFGD